MEKRPTIKSTITWEDFEKIDIRIGTIIEIEDFPEAKKPAYKLKIDLGQLGIKKSSAQITDLYTKEILIGKQVLCVCNLKPRQIGKFMSEVLVTGFQAANNSIILATTEQQVPNGNQLM